MTPRAAPVTLDTTGMQEMTGTQGERLYLDPSTGAKVALFILGHLAEPYWLDDLDLARRHLAREYAPFGCLIEANPITVGGVRGIAQLWKLPDRDQEHGLVFCVSVFLAKTTQTANIMYRMDESRLGATGIREAVVAELRMRELPVLDEAALDKLLMGEPHPYDPGLRGLLPFNPADDEAWDEKFPGHPLTCARAWLRGLDHIVTVDPAFAALPDFRGTSRGSGR